MNTELEEYKKLMLKKARLTSIVLGLAAVVAVLFMTYGFTQSIEAGRQRDIAIFAREESQKEIELLKEELAIIQEEAKRQSALAKMEAQRANECMANLRSRK